MRRAAKAIVHLLLINTTLLAVGCAVSPQYYPVAGSPDPYSVTPYRPDGYAQSANVPCLIPQSDALVAWAHGASTGERYHERQVDIQNHGRSTHCSLSERAGSYYGQPLPPRSSPHRYYYDTNYRYGTRYHYNY